MVILWGYIRNVRLIYCITSSIASQFTVHMSTLSIKYTNIFTQRQLLICSWFSSYLHDLNIFTVYSFIKIIGVSSLTDNITNA